MAYGSYPAVSSATVLFGSDRILGTDFTRIKLAFGIEGTVTDVSSAAPLPVSLTGSVAVTGGLTDAQLRATAVPVSFAGQSVGITGTVTASLGAPLPAGTNNIGDVDVLTVPTIATTTRAYDYASGVTVTAGAASARTGAGIAASEICVHNAGTVRAYIRQGSVSVDASIAATSLPIEPGEKMHLRHTSGDYVAAIRDGASDAAIRIVPVA